MAGDELQFEFVFGESRLELSLLVLLRSNREASEEEEGCCLQFCMLYSNGISILYSSCGLGNTTGKAKLPNIATSLGECHSKGHWFANTSL